MYYFFGINLADIAIILVLMSGMILGFSQGMIRQLIGLGVLYIAAVLATQYYPPLAHWLNMILKSNAPMRAIDGIAFFSVAIPVTLVLNYLSYDTYKTTRLQMFPVLDRFGGLLLGLVSIIVIISLTVPIFIFMLNEPWVSNDTLRIAMRDSIQSSQLAKYSELIKPPLVSIISPWLPGSIPAIFVTK
jgi:uncharacterized membrane protein required for colicin V production